MTLKLSLCCYCFVLLLEIQKSNRSIVSNMTLKLSLSCYCFVLLLFCFAIENTVKQPFNCLQYDTQTVLVLLLFCFAIGNTVKQPFSCSQYDTQTVLGLLLFCFVIVLICYWKYSKATVQLSTIWHSNCSGLVIVFFAIGNTIKQPFNCLQCDTQTVLLLLLFVLLLEIQ
jgi:hypothetical protein